MTSADLTDVDLSAVSVLAAHYPRLGRPADTGPCQTDTVNIQPGFAVCLGAP